MFFGTALCARYATVAFPYAKEVFLMITQGLRAKNSQLPPRPIPARNLFTFFTDAKWKQSVGCRAVMNIKHEMIMTWKSMSGRMGRSTGQRITQNKRAYGIRDPYAEGSRRRTLSLRGFPRNIGGCQSFQSYPEVPKYTLCSEGCEAELLIQTYEK